MLGRQEAAGEPESGAPLSSIQAAGASVVIPDAHLLFSAEFTRLGDDLLLTGPDGTTLLIQGYFALEVPPMLLSAAGAMMPPDLVDKLVGPLAPGQYAQLEIAQAEAPIGQVETVAGTAQATRADGTVVQLNVGDPVYQGDVVQTGANSKLIISFADETVFSLFANARMVLDSMVYDPNGPSNSLLFDLIQGTFTFVTGQIASTGDMRVNTPVATIGIRGTNVHISVDADSGAIQVSQSPGPNGELSTIELLVPGTNEVFAQFSDADSNYSVATPGASPVTFTKSPEQIEAEQTSSGEVQDIQNTVQERAQEEGEETEPETEEEPTEEEQGQLEEGETEQTADETTEGEAAATEEEQVVTDDTATEDTTTEETAEPIETGVGGDPIDSGGIGSFDEEQFGEEEPTDTEVNTSNDQPIDTSSPPTSTSDTPVTLELEPEPEPSTTTSEPVNAAPTVSLTGTVTVLSETTDTSAALKVANIVVSDDGNGTNVLSLSGADAGLFEIVGTELFLKAGTALDFETNPSLDVTVQVDDAAVGGTPDDTAILSISVTDVNEVGAVTDTNPAANQVAEDATIGATVGVTTFATDPDAGDTVSYSLTNNAGGRFAIDASTGVITVAGALDFETAASHQVTVRATSTDGSFTDQIFTIDVTDVDEFNVGAVSDTDGVANQVAENAANGTVVGITAFATDPDGSDSVSYSLTNNAGGRFAIDASTGVITVAGALDFETAASHQVTVRATSTDTSFTDQIFTINVTDVSEFNVGAVSDTDGVANQVAENAANGTVVGVTAFATDPDGTDSVSYTLTNNAGGRFAIDTNSGVITVAGALDFESAASHQVTVRATSTDTSFTDQIFTIDVTDVNESGAGPVTDTDGTPNQVLENASAGTTVGITAFAEDPDAGDSITYSLFDDAGGLFSINASTGVITVAGALDFETAASHQVTVRATSTDTSFTDQIFTIDVTDVDEFNVGAVSDTDGATNQVAENSANGTVVGVTAFAEDLDGTDSVTYSLFDDAGGRFAIDATTGVITVAGALDFETAVSHQITVRATSTDTSFTDQIFTIDVTDVDEFNVGTVSDTDGAANQVAEDAANGTAVGVTAFATDPDGTDSVTYSLFDDAGGRFAIDATSGVITVAGALDFESAVSHQITVRATSTDTSFTDQIFTIDVTDVDEFNVGTVSDTDGAANQVAENAANGTAVGITAFAEDLDGTDSVTYSLFDDAGGLFAIDATTGVITVVGALDFESAISHQVTVRATSTDASITDQIFTIDVSDVNEVPTVSLANTLTNLAEDADTASAIKVADIVVSDDALGTNVLTLSGADAGLFEIVGFELFLKAGTVLDFETNPSLDVTVEVDDAALGGTPDDTAILSITVTDVNDAPVVDLNGAGGGIDFADTFNEGGGAVLIAAGTATIADVDSTTLLSLTVTITNVQNGGQEVLVADTTGTSVIVTGNGTDSLTLSGGADLAEYEQVLRTITYENTSSNPTQGIRTIEVTADDGSGGISATATSSIDVIGINDPPAVALPGGALGYTENDGAVAIDGTATVSDPDSGDFAGGSLTVSFTANGTVNDQLSIENQGTGAGQIGISGGDVTFGGVVIGTFSGGTDGSTPLVITFTTASATPAAVQALAQAITYENTSEAPSELARTVEFTLVDGDGGTDTDTASTTINVTAVNDAPVLDNSGVPALTAIGEDAADPAGDTVSAILATGAGGDPISDADTGALEGIAVTGVDDANGTWQYSTDGGTIWTAFGAVSDASAVLLAPDALVRFVPDADFTGAASITFRAWDQTTGASGDTGVDVSTNGGTTAYSTATETASVTVNAVNDAPVLDNSGAPALTAIDEDVVDPAGDTVSAILATGAGGDPISDVDAGALDGIAVTGVDDANGTWQYSTDGGTIWTAFGAVSDASAVLLAPDALVRFVPDADFTGAASITFRAWDQTSGSSGDSGVDVSVNGGTTAYSTATETASVTVNNLNDAPVISNLAGDALAYSEGDGAVVIEQGADALVTDIDSTDFNTGQLTVSISSGGDVTEDVLSIRDSGTPNTGIEVSGGNVSFDGVLIGTFTGGTSGTDLVVTLNASADAAAVTALVQAITYENTDIVSPTLSARTIDFTLSDGDGGTSATDSTTVTVSAVTSMTWTNASTDGDWHNAANWDPAVVPGDGDDVTIPNGLGAVTYSTGTTSLNSLTASDALIISGGTLNLGAASSFDASAILDLAGGTLGGVGAVTVAGGFTWSAGTLTGTGAFTVSGTASIGAGSLTLDGRTLTLTGSGTITGTTLGGTGALDNQGALTVEGTVSINVTFSNAALTTLTVQGSISGGAGLNFTNGFTNLGLIELTNSDTVARFATLSLTGGTLVNQGTIQSLAGSGGGNRIITAQIDNQGTIDVDHSLFITNTGTTFTSDSGTLDVATSQTLVINGGTTELGTGTVLAGDGLVDLAGTLTLNLVSDLTLTSGGTQLSFGGTVTVNGPGALINQAILILTSDIVNADLTNQGTLQSNTSTINGTLLNQGPLVFLGSTVAGDLENAIGGSLSVQGAVSVGGTFSNAGGASVAIFGTSSLLDASLTIANGFINQGVIQLTNGAGGVSANLTVTSGTLVNQGTIRTFASGGSRTINAQIDNQGIIEVDQSLTIDNGGTTFTSTSGTIDVAAGQTLTVSGGTTVLGSGTVFAGTGILDLAGTHNLSLASDLTLPSGGVQLTLSGLVGINGTGTLINQGSLTLTGDTVNVTLDNQGALIVEPGNSFINGTLSNNASGSITVRATDAGSLTLTVASGFTNQGLIELTNIDTVARVATLTVSSGTLVNTGTILTTPGTGAGNRIINGSIDNQGTIDIDRGTIIFGTTFTSDNGTLDIATGQTLSINGGTTVLGTGTTFLGTGALNLTGTHTLNLASDLTLAASSVQLSLGGTVTVNGPGTLINQATLILSSDTVNAPLTNEGTLFSNTSTINGALLNTGSLTFFGGTVTGGLENAIGGTVDVQGTLGVSGAFSNAAGATVTVVGSVSFPDASLTIASGFTNLGTIVLTNASGNSASLVVTSGTLVNQGTITSVVGSLGGRTIDAQIDNQGTIDLGYSLTVDNVGRTMTNTGLIDITSGRTLTVDGGTFDNAVGGTIQGSGTLDVSTATFTNSGTINPGTSAGSLSITGDFEQTVDGVLIIEIGGTNAIDFDTLDISGTATLAGTLNIILIDAFVPSSGDSFQIFTAGATAGDFDVVIGLDINSGLAFEASWVGGVFTLVTDAGPTISNLAGDVLAYTEGDGAQVIEQGNDALVLDVDDTDLEGATVTITDLVNVGEEFLDASTGGTSIIASYDANTGILTLTGTDTLANYQLVLRSVTYENTSDDPTLAGSDTQRNINFIINDGALASLAALAMIDITAVNDAPVATLPADQDKIEETDLVFSAANGNAVVISDVDAGSQDLEVMLAVSSGILTLNGVTGLAFTVGDGTADATMTFTGNLADINAALDGLIYSSDGGFAGLDTLSVDVSDLGSTGTGGTLLDSKSLDITVADFFGDVTFDGLNLVVGDAGFGRFAIDGGSDLAVDSVIVGNQTTGFGTLRVSGAGTTLTVADAANAGVVVGNEGKGSLTLSDGATLTIASDVLFDHLDIGRTATGAGVVVVEGSDTTLTTSGIDNTVQVGRVGTGYMLIRDEATVETLQFEAGRFGTGVAVITGAGTTVVASNDDGLFSDPFTFEAGFVRAGRESGGDGTILILDGASLTIRSGIGVNEDTTSPELQIARNAGSVGFVVVSGAGSLIDIVQLIPETTNGGLWLGGAFLTVGREGDGELVVHNGGTVNLTGYADATAGVGTRAGGVGLLEVEGTDSTLNIVTNNVSDGSLSFGSTLIVGGAGSGNLSVDQGGTVNITAVGTAFLGVGMTAGKFGSVLVEGPGTSINLTTSAISTAGVTRGADVVIGDGGAGFLNIVVGGQVNVNGETNASLRLGGLSTGNGTLRVSGSGSTLSIFTDLVSNNVDSFGAMLNVGDQGTGNLTVRDGGQVFLTGFATAFVNLGGAASGDGSILVEGAGSTLTVQTDNAKDGTTTFGASLIVGNQGTGTLTITHGGVVNVLGAVAGDASIAIAEAGGSDGTVTVRGDGSELNIGGHAIVGGAFTDVGFGTDGVPTTGTLGIFGGGLVSVTDNMNVASDDVDAIGVVTVSGMSLLDIGQDLSVGMGAGAGNLTLLNGGRVEADSGVFIGVNGVMTVGSGSVMRPSGIALNIQDDNFSLGGVLNLGDSGSSISFGSFTVQGDYLQEEFSTLNIELEQGGGLMAVTGTATFETNTTVNLTRLGSARFGDAFTLTAASLAGLIAADFNLSQPADGLIINSADITNGVQFTTITSGATVDGSAIAIDINETDTEKLLTGTVTNTAIDLSSTATNQGLLALNGAVTTNSVNVTGTGTSRLVFNGTVTADDFDIDNTGSGTVSTGVIGPTGDVTITNFVVVGTSGSAFSELFVYGSLSANGMVIGSGLNTTGSVVVDGGFISLGGGGLTVGSEGTGELTIQNGGIVDVADFTVIANGGGSTGAVTVTGDGSKLISAQGMNVGDGFVATVAEDDFDFGQAGVPTTGSLDILNGGFVRALNINVGTRDDATGSILVDGVGSTLITFETGGGGNQINLGQDFDATGVGGEGTMTVSGGGYVSTAVLMVGESSAAGNLLTVTDPGSVVRVSNDEGLAFGDANEGGFLRAARNDGDVGEIRVLNGGQIFVTSGPTQIFGPGLQIARNDGSIGRVLIDGAGQGPGETFIQVFTPNPEDPGGFGPYIQVGRTGDGELIIQNGGEARIIGEGAVLQVSRGNSELVSPDPVIDGNVPLLAARSDLLILSGGRMLVDGLAGEAVVNIGQEANANGFVLVSGAGSRLDVEGASAVINVGLLGIGEMQILDGGVVETTSMFIGQQAGSDGTVLVDGIGTFLQVGHADTVDQLLAVGGFDGGTGTLTISGGATLETFNLQAGVSQSLAEFPNNLNDDPAVLDGSRGDGTINITGTGTTVILSNEFGSFSAPFDNEGGFLRIARGDGDVGVMTVSDGALIQITSFLHMSGPGLQIARNPGSQGTVTVDNATIDIFQFGPSTAFDGGPFLQVGRSGEGSLTIQNGGLVRLSGQGSIVQVSRGNTDQGGSDTLLAQSTLNILTGGDLILDGMDGTADINIGQEFNANGAVNVTGPGSTIEVTGAGASLAVGRAGTGELTVSAGAVISILGLVDPNDIFTVPNFDIGFARSGDGTVTVTGTDSAITLSGTTGTEAGSIDIGRFGTGTLNILDGGTVSNTAAGITTIGREAGSSGTVLVAGLDSTLDAGFRLLIGEDYDFTAGVALGAGTGGTGTLTIGALGTVIADQVFVGTDGTIGGVGTLVAATTTLDGGRIAAGASAGTLTIGGDLTTNSGAFEVELGGTGAGLSDLISVTGAADMQGVQVELALINGYVPGNGDQVTILSATGGISLDPARLSLAISGVGQILDFSVGIVGNDLVFTANEAAVAGNRAFFFGSDLDDTYVGGDGDDVLDGAGGNDTFTGGLGDDTIDGGAGTKDLAVFAGSVIEFSIETDEFDTTTVVDLNAADGDQGSDTLTTIEELAFDDFEGTFAELAAATFGTLGDDDLAGTAGSDRIFALAGNDTVTGGDGDDELRGGDGDDTLTGGAGNDELRGGLGNDVLDGGDGNDMLWGGDGNDTAIYSSSPSGVTVNLGAGTAQDGFGGTDILNSIENVVGSDFADTLIGSDGNNRLTGGGGLDLLQGGTGNDTYVFSIGDDLNEIRDAGGGADRADVVTGFTSLAELIEGIDEFDFFFDSSDTVLVLEMSAETALELDRSDFLAIADATGAGKIEQFTFDFLPGLVFDFGAAGTGGNDFIVLDSGTSIADGLDGHDIIIGNDENNTLTGGAGDDILDARGGSNTLDGGAGNDSLFGSEGNDTLTGGADDDLLSGSGGVNSLQGGDGNDVYLVFGGDGNDTIGDTSGADTLQLEDGVEIESLSRSVDDLIFFFADGGEVTIVDHFAGKPLETLVLKDEGLSFQILTGGIVGTTGNDVVTGTSTGGETLIGDDGHDILSGGGGGDTLQGGAGNDILFGASGDDALDGGDGTGDIVNYRASSEGITVSLSIGAAQTISASMGTDTLTNIEGVVGSDFVDAITGSAGNDIIEGAGGDDVLAGLGGDDTYRWGTGEGLDTIDDLSGTNDLIVFQTEPDDTPLTPAGLDVSLSGNNLLIRHAFAPGEGMTIVDQLTTGTIEGFMFDDLDGALLLFNTGAPGAGNDFIVLDDSANIVDGLDGIDAIYGNGGDDELHGGNDNDSLIGGAGADQLFGDAGDDVLVDGLAGNSDIDTLSGGLGADLLVSRGGNDILSGGEGDDNYEVTNEAIAAVTISDTGGTDVLEIGGGVQLIGMVRSVDDLLLSFDSGATVTITDHFAGQRVEILQQEFTEEPFIISDDLSFTTSGSDLIAGTSGSDTIDGLAGNDMIFGNEGADTLTGGLGADTLTGGTGADTFTFAEGDGGATIDLADLLTDFEDGTDLIGLEGGLTFADLTIADGGGSDTTISVTATSEILAVVQGVTDNLLTESDFTVIV